MSEGVDWSTPIGDAHSAVLRAEQIRKAAYEISEWAMEEWTSNSFEAKIAFGLTAQARVGVKAADAVSRDLVRLLQKLHYECRDVASTASVFGEHMQHLYIEPIEEAERAPRSGGGLKVNK